jgi:hypothetical protein
MGLEGTMHATPRPRRNAEPPSSVPVSGPATRRAATLASVVALALPLAVGAAAQADPGKGNGNGPPGTPPGQAKKQEQAAQPAPAAPAPARPARPAKPTKPAAPRSNARGHEKRSSGAGGQPKQVAPKVSRGGPRQQGAPAGRPVRADGKKVRGGGKDKARGGQRGGGQAKMTICHATGSATNPFVVITIAMPAVAAHARHQDGRDIIPAPAEGCPVAARAVAPGAVVKPPGLPPGAPALAPGAPAPAVVAPVAPAVGAPAPIAGEVLGAFDEQPEAALEEIAAAAPVTEVREEGAEAGGLPFTGVELWVLAVAGAAALLAGVAASRALTRGGS